MIERRPKRILVADDTLPMRIMLQDVLLEAGYEVVTAADGQEAWDLLLEEGKKLDLLILDLLMPRMTGFEIMEKLPELHLQPARRVLVVTGIFKSGKEIQRLKELGASGYITKSALVDEILFRVNQVFHLGHENSRQHPRVLMSLPVDYRVGGQQLSNYSSNVSAGGLFIRAIDPAPLDETIEVTFKIPELNQTVSAKGRVVWTNEYETLRKKSSLPGMGVKFLDLDVALERTIAAYVADKLVNEPVWLDPK
jgi:uncharacterized protein (TIGR02266 family)